jgi:hypothetical protein
VRTAGVEFAGKAVMTTAWAALARLCFDAELVSAWLVPLVCALCAAASLQPHAAKVLSLLKLVR